MWPALRMMQTHFHYSENKVNLQGFFQQNDTFNFFGLKILKNPLPPKPLQQF
jgi:hypothetical protein